MGVGSELLSVAVWDFIMLLSMLLSSLIAVPISGQGPLFSWVAVLCIGQSEISNCMSLFFAKARLNVQIPVDIETNKMMPSVVRLECVFQTSILVLD